MSCVVSVANKRLRVDIGQLSTRSPMTRAWVVLSAGLQLLAIVVQARAAAPADSKLQLTSLFPPVASIGSSSEITAEGSFPDWPVDIFCDRDDVRIECGTEAKKLLISVADRATPGVAWVRLYNRSSASQLLPILIEQSPVLVEAADQAKSHVLSASDLPLSLCGKIRKQDEIDFVSVSLATGQRLKVTTVANRLLQSPMDAVLQITDRQGNVLMQNDDERGLDPQLTFTARESQEVLVRILAFPETPNSTIAFAGSESYAYIMQMSLDSPLDHFLPLLAVGTAEPFCDCSDEASAVVETVTTGLSPRLAFVRGQNVWQWLPQLPSSCQSKMEPCEDEPIEALVSLPSCFSGHIASEREIDVFRFSAEAGRKYRARVFSREFGFPLDSTIQLVDAETHAVIAENDDGSRNDYDARVDFSVKSDSVLELRIGDAAGSSGYRHAYTALVEPVVPSVQLTVATAEYALAIGGDVELSVAIRREDNCLQPLEIVAVDLPAGVTCAAVRSEPKGDSSKSVKLKLAATNEVSVSQGTFRIIATEIGGQTDSIPCIVSQSVVHLLRPQVPISDFWLTVYEQQK
ncbi:MAG: hypothetical protein KDB22_20235 [Planctomycetales bacterium]|nr:hypothetical protein [Planctomycetales bacterium]